MKKKMKKLMLSAFLIASLVSTSCVNGFAIGGSGEVFNGRVFVSDVKSQLAPGAWEHKITTNNTSGTDQNIDFVTEIDLAGTNTIKIMSCYAGYSTIKDESISWKMMTLPEQAQKTQAYFDANPTKYPNYKVVGALNGDIYNMGTGQPTHVLIIDGITYQQANGEDYFAIDKTGKAVITNDKNTSNLDYAIGGWEQIVKDGENIAQTGNALTDSSVSRTAIGIKNDGTVISFCTYGNSYPISCGYTWSEVADYMIAQGCIDALMLDGGGSAEWCARYEGTNSVQSVSHPSDGYSRATSSCLLIVSTAAPDGTFARASVTPSATVYTPNSTVQFEAVGADSAGNAVTIPEDATWSLSDSKYGTIDQTGSFVSNGTCGNVTVNLNYKEEACGTSTITIAAPDSITFSKSSEDVGRGKSSNLGLQVRYQNKNVILKEGDIAWTLTNDDKDSNVVIGTIRFSGGEYLFTGNSSVTCSGTVKAEYSKNNEISGSIQVKVGTDPVKALDFEAPADGKTLKEYYGLDDDGYVIGRIKNVDGGGTEASTSGILTRLYYGRGGNETARIVSASGGYPVHSGSYALQVNYDFSNCASGITEGANVGLTEAIDIPGHPTAIGLWVWVPENTPNLWLRVRLNLYNSAGTLQGTTQFDFGPEMTTTFPEDGSYGGLTVCEEGTWHFCTADLSNYDGYTFQIPAGEAIRLMCVDGAAELEYNGRTVRYSHGGYLKDGTKVSGSNLKGSVYFDDLMFIYGSVNEDTDAPVVKDALLGDNTEFCAGMTVTSNKESYTFYMEDAKGASGIDPVGLDYEACYLYVDGDLMNYKAGTVIDHGSYCIRTDVTLANGKHSIRLLLSDLNGNKSSKTYNFTVNGNESTYPRYSLKTNADFAPLGGSVPLTVHTTDATNINKFTTTIQVDSRYRSGGYKVTAAEGFSYADGSAKYDEVNNTVTFEVTKNGEKTGDCDLATIEFNIDRNLESGSYFSYTVAAGIETAKTTQGEAINYHGGFSLPQARLEVEAPYTISSDLLYKDMENPGYVYVKNTDGNPVSGIGIYRSNGTQLGTTDEYGKWQVSADLLNTAQQLVVYASCDSGISFNETISIFGTDATESPVIFTACGGDGTTKQLSWLSDIQKNVQFRYAGTQEALENAKAIAASTEPVKFGGSSFSNAVTAQINSVKLESLEQGKYYYQYRYGNGEWKKAASFVVERTKSTTNFFVLGDVQASDTSNIEAIIKNLKNGEYAFGIQTGDLVDQAYSYSHWKEALTLMSKLGDQDMIYALGNHEDNMGDDGSIAKKIYRMPNKDYYSVEYGNVYVANISYNSSDGYKKALEWLVTDAKKSSAKWKIVAMHQPTYYTNSTATDNLGMDSLTPSYLQEAGINVVFSGHDHSYARTAALMDGKRSGSYNAENETCNRGDGIVYYICGSSGEKSYPIDPTLPFDYKATGDFNAIYLTAEATEDTLTVKTYNLTDAKTGETDCIDTFTMYASSCVTEGHSFGENSNYDIQEKTLTCTSCGKAVQASQSKYTGVVKSGENQVYLFNGTVKTGWITNEEEILHAGDDGLLHSTTTTDTATCLKNGYIKSTCSCGATYKGSSTWSKGHTWNDSHVCTVCGKAGIDMDKVELELNGTAWEYTGTAIRPSVSGWYKGQEIYARSDRYGTDAYKAYSNNINVGCGTVTFEGRGDFYGEKSIQFPIVPKSVKTVSAANTFANTVVLEWEAAAGAQYYNLAMKNSSGQWETIQEKITACKAIVEGLSPSTEYSFGVTTGADAEGESFEGLNRSDTLIVKTESESSSKTENLITEISASVDGTQTAIAAKQISGKKYIYLPSCADLTALKLNISTSAEALTLMGAEGSTVYSDEAFDLTKIAAKGESGAYELMLQADGSEPMKLYIMKAENLSAIFITSDDSSAERNYVDSAKGNSAAANMLMLASSGSSVYSGHLKQVKSRGNSTFIYYDKKSYQIKLETPSDLLGTGESVKTWVLLAGYADATQMHDKLFKDLATNMKLAYTASSDWVDLYYDGEYRGIYLLSEKNSVGTSSVNITNMEKAYEIANPETYGKDMQTATGTNKYGQTYQYALNADGTTLTDPTDITGGYLIERNLNEIDEACGFYTREGGGFNVKSPEYASENALKYISEYYQEFEDAVLAKDAEGNYTGINPTTGKHYSEYCDKDSLVKIFLLQELAANCDGFLSSFYFYKDAGSGLLYAGPIWDQEITLGMSWSYTIDPTETRQYYLAKALIKIPDFAEAVKEYYKSDFQGLIKELIAENGTVDAYAAKISNSAAMNYTLWPLVKVADPGEAEHLWKSGTTYEKVLSNMKEWIAFRINNLDVLYADGEAHTEHSYVSEVTKPATTSEEGIRTYKCTVCGRTYTEKIAKISSGGGGGGVVVIPPTDTKTDDDGKAAATVKPVEKTETDGKKTTSATIDTATGSKIVENAIASKSTEVVVDAATSKTVTETASGSKTEVAIPATTVSDIAEKTEAAVTIRSDAAEVTIDKEAVKSIAEQTGTTGMVKLIVETVAQDKNKLQLELKLETSKGEVSDFKGGKVSITVKLNSELAAKPVVCVYIDAHDVYHKIGGQKKPDGTFTFKTGHFSSYAVMAEEEADKVIAEQAAKAEKLVKTLKLKARSAKTAKGNIKVTLTVDSDAIKAIEDLGYTVKYKFYRSTKKAASYKAATEKAGKTYTNTTGKKGTKYYYKARVTVYDAEGALVAKSELKQCKYAARVK